MERHWYQDAIIYHVFSPSIANASFENDYREQKHTFAVFEKWLPHIKKLGCNTVLFSPILKARSHGYDVTDYFTIDNRIGTNEEFKDLVRLYHENGVKVLLDSVFNHCGRDFFAFKELQNGNRDFAEWFSGVDFGHQSPLGDDFTYDTWSGHFSLPKFNLHSEKVRGYLFDALSFWISEFDIDGMRLDAANTLDFGFMRDLRRAALDMKPDFWLMGEVVHGDYTRWVNENTLHSVTNYILYKALFSSHNDNNLYELAHAVQNSQPQNGLPLYNFIDNHDQPRIASNIGSPGFLKTLHALLFTLPGIPSVYYGSEWGIQGKAIPGSDAPLRPYIDIENPPGDETWLCSYIKKLADVRRQSNALKYGAYRQISLEYQKPYVFERAFGDERVYIAVNIGGQGETVNLAAHMSGSFTDLMSGEPKSSSDAASIAIDPMSARILSTC
ncbi:MAG: alpha-amylase family glycosyl hydrolase [Oscillospiraceae bacterium]|nr:alpha-amylase family glycosyl hydrolase [Oscillospiraceae bacterium]